MGRVNTDAVIYQGANKPVGCKTCTHMMMTVFSGMKDATGKMNIKFVYCEHCDEVYGINDQRTTIVKWGITDVHRESIAWQRTMNESERKGIRVAWLEFPIKKD